MSEFPLLSVRILHSEPALGKVRRLAVSREGDVLWAGTDSGVVLELGLPTGVILRRFHAHKGGVTAVRAHRGRLLTCGKDGAVRLWDVRRLGCVRARRTPARSLLPGVGDVERLRADIPELLRVTAIAREGPRTALAGHGPHRNGLLSLVDEAGGRPPRTWALPYGAASLAWVSLALLIAGGNGRLFAIALPD